MKTIKIFKTDFEFKDKRTYVHASTLLEVLTKRVYEDVYPEEKWEAPRIDAIFHKPVSSNGLLKLIEDPDLLVDDDSVNAAFRFYSDDRNISATFHEDKHMGIVRRKKTHYAVEDIVLDKDFSGSCKIDCSNRVSVVENIIEANKRFHLLTFEDRSSDLKIKNLYMRRFPISLPFNEDIDYERTLLKAENISVRKHDSSVVTLNSLYFPELKVDPFEISYIIEGT